MNVRCRHCQSAILPGDINHEHMIAKCSRCHTVFDFSDQLNMQERQAPGALATLSRIRPEVALPKGWRMQKHDGGPVAVEFNYRANPSQPVPDLTLTWRWFSGSKVVMFIVALIWNGAISFAIGELPKDMPWYMYVFLSLFVAVGVILAYTAVTGIVNSTTVSIKHGQLLVRHGPLPWSGQHTLEKDTIKQLFCKQNISTSTDSEGNTSSTVSYEVHAQLSDKEITLISDLEESDQALYIEQLLEGALDIKDVMVAGEWFG